MIVDLIIGCIAFVASFVIVEKTSLMTSLTRFSSWSMIGLGILAILGACVIAAVTTLYQIVIVVVIFVSAIISTVIRTNHDVMQRGKQV